MKNTSSPAPASTNPYPWWAPRFWHGMLFTDWLRLLTRYGGRVHPARWGVVIGVTATSTFNSKMRLAQTALMGHRIQQAELPRDPVFVLGHWRSGTTLLHELLAVDDHFVTPTTYQCFAANHFLLTETVITRLLWFLMPSKRPMDNMAAGWHEPQEDEFALCSMGIPSPYLHMAFPNADPRYLAYLDLRELNDEERLVWQRGLEEFLRRLVTHRPGKRVVLKSPTHTARVELLAEMFPEAKFLHITRNPFDIVPSTIRLWNSLNLVQGLQMPRRDMEDYVHGTFRRMYDAYFEAQQRLPADRLINVRYEDLVQDGCGVLQDAYERLDLGDFERIRAPLEAKLSAKRNYQRNRHQLDRGLIDRIQDHWADYFTQFDYAPEPPATTP